MPDTDHAGLSDEELDRAIAERTEAIAKEKKTLLQEFPATRDEALIALRRSKTKHLTDLQEELPRLLEERTRRGR
jgi:hypothetical protein